MELVKVVRKNAASGKKDADISVFHTFSLMSEQVSPEHLKTLHC